MDDFDLDDGDSYMAASIAEAEKEIDLKKTGKYLDLHAQIKQLEHESTLGPVEGITSLSGKMAEDMISSALTSKTNVNFDGDSIQVQNSN